MKTSLKFIIGALAIMAIGYLSIAASNSMEDDYIGRDVYAQTHSRTLSSADSSTLVELRELKEKISGQITFKSDTVTTFYLQGSNVEDTWPPIDTAAVTTTPITLTVTDLPRFVRVYTETAAVTSTQDVGFKLSEQE